MIKYSIKLNIQSVDDFIKQTFKLIRNGFIFTGMLLMFPLFIMMFKHQHDVVKWRHEQWQKQDEEFRNEENGR